MDKGIAEVVYGSDKAKQKQDYQVVVNTRCCNTRLLLPRLYPKLPYKSGIPP